MRRLRLAILVVSALLLIPARLPAADEPNVGAKLTARPDISLSELALNFQLFVWKFDVEKPAGAKFVRMSPLLIDGNGKAQPLTGSTTAQITRDAKSELTFAILPSDNEIADSERIRVVVRGYSYHASTGIPNPLKGLHVAVPQKPIRNADGSYTVLNAYKGDTSAAQADYVVAIRIDVLEKITD